MIRPPLSPPRLRRLTAALLLPAALALAPAAAHAQASQQTLLADGCKVLAERVGREAGSGPVFLASYEPAPGGEPARVDDELHVRVRERLAAERP